MTKNPPAEDPCLRRRWRSTGIGGPDGGTPEKPVGTVFIGLGSPAGTAVTKRLNVWDRQPFKQVTCQQALEMLRLTILRPA